MRNLSRRNNTRCYGSRRNRVQINSRLGVPRLFFLLFFYFKYLLIAGSDILGNLPTKEQRSPNGQSVIARREREALEKIPRQRVYGFRIFSLVTVAIVPRNSHSTFALSLNEMGFKNNREVVIPRGNQHLFYLNITSSVELKNLRKS